MDLKAVATRHFANRTPAGGTGVGYTGAGRASAGRAGKAAAVLFLGVAGFQGALALGAPWGSAAYGGGNPGGLPDSMRMSSAGAAGVYLVLAAAAGTSLVAPALRRRLTYATAGLMAVGAVMNLASPSLVERMIWTPATVVLGVLLWNAAKHDAVAPD
ncbi:hypothetical protein [Arthrobacter sp. UYCu712]|uniref:hypothetical protein n=1 Tax=Arthrobacter sp. UYCu712 TaxID=3156340 RepID=UPI0033956CDC